MSAREFDPACPECNNRHMKLNWTRGDLGDLRRKARSARDLPGIAERLALAKADVESAEVEFEAHVAEAHPDGFVTAPRKIADVRRKPPPPVGKVQCLSCGKWLPGERSLCGRCSVVRSA